MKKGGQLTALLKVFFLMACSPLLNACANRFRVQFGAAEANRHLHPGLALLRQFPRWTVENSRRLEEPVSGRAFALFAFGG